MKRTNSVLSSAMLFDVFSEKNFAPATFVYVPDLLGQADADSLLPTLISSVPWKKRPIKKYGGHYKIPRLITFFAAEKRAYKNPDMGARDFVLPTKLEWLLEKTKQFTGTCFNSVILNYSRDGNELMPWHRNGQSELIYDSLIAVVSLGAVREFRIRGRDKIYDKFGLRLEHGSLLLMKETIYKLWEHRIMTSDFPVGPRLSITFRSIKPASTSDHSTSEPPSF